MRLLKSTLVIGAVLASLIASSLTLRAIPISQEHHMALVQRHIARIDNDWRRFRSERPERRYTYIQVDTAGDGALGVFGIVAAQEIATEIIKFVEGTKPQRPVISHLEVWDSESFMDDGGALEILERQIQWIEGQRATR